MTTPGRFRINPVEVAIFGVVSILLFHSIYNLFYDRRVLEAGSLIAGQTATNPAGRMPAAMQSFQNLEIKCVPRQEIETQAAKLRLTGPLCGATGAAKLQKTQILNQTNQFTATVFTDLSAGKFSTDYIPLVAGKNSILVEFSFEQGKAFTQELLLTKN